MYGTGRLTAAEPDYPEADYYGAHSATRSQKFDMDIAHRDIICPELRQLAYDMIHENHVWPADYVPTAATGEFREDYGNVYQSNHTGTIFIEESAFWVEDPPGSGFYAFVGNPSDLALLLAHEAAHAWFGYDETIGGDAHIEVYQLAHDCVD